MVLFVFQFYPVCNFSNFGLCTVKSERAKSSSLSVLSIFGVLFEFEQKIVKIQGAPVQQNGMFNRS